MKEEIKMITGEETLVLQEPQTETKEVVVEERTMRQPNKKVFRTKDAKQAVFYGTPVHFQQTETNSLEEIDNTLVEEEDGKYFKNTKNSFKARFPKEADSEELFSMEQDNCRVTLSLPKQGKHSRKGILPMQKQKREWFFKM